MTTTKTATIENVTFELRRCHGFGTKGASLRGWVLVAPNGRRVAEHSSSRNAAIEAGRFIVPRLMRHGVAFC